MLEETIQPYTLPAPLYVQNSTQFSVQAYRHAIFLDFKISGLLTLPGEQEK